MPQDEEIELAGLQFENLLNNGQRESFNYLLNHTVFCPNCSRICPEGVVDYIIYLTDADEVLMKGKCGKCGSGVTKLMLLDEDADFEQRVRDIRNQ